MITILGESYIGHLILVGVVQNIVQDVYGCLWLDCNAGADTEAVDVLDELFGVCLLVAGGLGRLGSGGIDSGLIVEAVQVAAGFLEILDPFLRLLEPVSCCVSCRGPVFPVQVCHPLFLSFMSVPRRSSCGSRRCPFRRPQQASRHEGGSW